MLLVFDPFINEMSLNNRLNAPAGAFQDLALTLRASLAPAADSSGSRAPAAYLATTIRDAANQAAFFAMLQPLRLEATLLKRKEGAECSVQFRHLTALRNKRDSIVLHRITAARRYGVEPAFT
jgi:hypothetical protein